MVKHTHAHTHALTLTVRFLSTEVALHTQEYLFFLFFSFFLTVFDILPNIVAKQ